MLMGTGGGANAALARAASTMRRVWNPRPPRGGQDGQICGMSDGGIDAGEAGGREPPRRLSGGGCGRSRRQSCAARSLGARVCLATALRTNCLQPRKVDKESLTTESRAPMRKSLRKSSRRFGHGGVGYHPCLSSSGSRRQTLLALLRCAVPSPSTAVRDPPRVPRSHVQSRAVWCLGSAARFLPEHGCG